MLSSKQVNICVQSKCPFRPEHSFCKPECREDPNVLLTRRSQQLGLSQITTSRILHYDLYLKTYKFRIAQELKPADHRMRRSVVAWVLEQLEADSNFASKIIFSDVAHIWFCGFLNKHNCSIGLMKILKWFTMSSPLWKSHCYVRVLGL